MENLELNDKNRETYGRYSGICTSYHHSKACLCIKCPSYPGNGMMFCARKNQHKASSKTGCLCLQCHIHDKFRLEGDYFCFIL
ncbi:DUF2769 domain-containing protein [uncultured Methanolobus sp.]|uniref:DUF2769 domain-containing protein n=1 Tax=uncultured Methanolobus sp. TaxID=218300 RepID=UPI0029C82D1E|nr:DUF2769 domain-containing protein [uncultured Methanolobus sp.]